MLPPEMGLVDALVSASIANVVVFLPFALLLAWIVHRSGRTERRIIVEELRDEVGRSVTEPEYTAIVADRMLRTRRIDGRRPHVSAALVNAQNELAIRKRRLRDRGFDPALDARLEQRRVQIAVLRQQLNG
jgi:hypothetical protein